MDNIEGTCYSTSNSIPINRPDIPNLKFTDITLNKSAIGDFENNFLKWFGHNGSFVLTSSGKISIYLLFKALELKGNIITSPLSCSMAFAPLIANNIDIKFADINPNTFLIDENSIEPLIDKNTKAIYIIHLGGMMPDMDKIKTIATKNNILLIEDCAQALGSTYNKTKAGAFGDFSCFSFAKNMWLAGGGGIFSTNKKIISKIKTLQNKTSFIPDSLIKYRFNRDSLEAKRALDIEADNEYYNKYFLTANNANIGIDYKQYFTKADISSKPSALQASILNLQINDIDKKNKTRQKIAEKIIKSLEKLAIFQVNKNCNSVYSKLYLTSKNKSNKELLPKLVKVGIDAKHLTKSHGIHFQERFDINPNFASFLKTNLPNYIKIHDKIIAIPISSNLKEKEISYIINYLKILFNE